MNRSKRRHAQRFRPQQRRRSHGGGRIVVSLSNGGRGGAAKNGDGAVGQYKRQRLNEVKVCCLELMDWNDGTSMTLMHASEICMEIGELVHTSSCTWRTPRKYTDRWAEMSAKLWGRGDENDH